MLLVNIPRAKRIWGLPFLTVLAPSERYYESKPHGSKKLTDCVSDGHVSSPLVAKTQDCDRRRQQLCCLGVAQQSAEPA